MNLNLQKKIIGLIGILLFVLLIAGVFNASRFHEGIDGPSTSTPPPTVVPNKQITQEDAQNTKLKVDNKIQESSGTVKSGQSAKEKADAAIQKTKK